jgi:predicted AAA+ superfamily ATPase
MAKKRSAPWVPRPEDYERIFAEQNPWHLTGQVPEEWAKRIERPLARFLPRRLQADEPRRFQLILGPRRVGKTTSMYQTVRDLLASGVPADRLWWLRLDHPLLMEMRLDQLVWAVTKFLQLGKDPQHITYLFLDEITYSDKWDLWLKTFYDERWPVRIVGTSSSTAAIKGRMLESGVGRWEEQYLAPYLFSEYLALIDRPVSIPVGDTLAQTIESCIDGRVDITDLARFRRRFLLTGGFPELLISGHPESADEATLLLHSQRILNSDAVERAIYKDIPQAFSVDNPMMLERVLYTLAGQVTGVLSTATICQSLGGLSQPTFERYLSYLVRAFLVFTLPNYSGSESSVQKRGRKVYFVDAAVRNAALQRGLAPLDEPGEMGMLLENMAASHLHALSEQSQVRVYHWRDKNDEVDLIYDQPEAPLAFEIGSSIGHHRRGLQAFVGRFPRFEGRCFLVAPSVSATHPKQASDGIGTLPLDLFLLAVGAQAEHELIKRLSP